MLYSNVLYVECIFEISAYHHGSPKAMHTLFQCDNVLLKLVALFVKLHLAKIRTILYSGDGFNMLLVAFA